MYVILYNDDVPDTPADIYLGIVHYYNFMKLTRENGRFAATSGAEFRLDLV